MQSQDDSYIVRGRTVTLPLEVRKARSWNAQFLVPADAAQRLVAPTGLEVARPLPGRAMCTLAFVRYEEGDLGAYNELAVSFVVRPHGSEPASAPAMAREFATGRIGVYIYHLPVTEQFSLDAGRGIWGFPKFLSSIEIREARDRATCVLQHEGRDVLMLTVRTGGHLRLPQVSPPTYSYIDDKLRLTRWTTTGSGAGARVGGAKLTLGSHPIADELRSIGLPKGAAMTGSVRHMRARFGPAELV